MSMVKRSSWSCRPTTRRKRSRGPTARSRSISSMMSSLWMTQAMIARRSYARRMGIHTFIHEKNLGYGGNQKSCYRAP